MSKFDSLFNKVIGEAYLPAKVKKPAYGLQVGNIIYKKGDVMDECPFEGSMDAKLLAITPLGDGRFEFDILADGEGYTYSTDDIAEMGIDAKVVQLKK